MWILAGPVVLFAQDARVDLLLAPNGTLRFPMAYQTKVLPYTVVEPKLDADFGQAFWRDWKRGKVAVYSSVGLAKPLKFRAFRRSVPQLKQRLSRRYTRRLKNGRKPESVPDYSLVPFAVEDWRASNTRLERELVAWRMDIVDPDRPAQSSRLYFAPTARLPWKHLALERHLAADATTQPKDILRQMAYNFVLTEYDGRLPENLDTVLQQWRDNQLPLAASKLTTIKVPLNTEWPLENIPAAQAFAQGKANNRVALGYFAEQVLAAQLEQRVAAHNFDVLDLTGPALPEAAQPVDVDFIKKEIARHPLSDAPAELARSLAHGIYELEVTGFVTRQADGKVRFDPLFVQVGWELEEFSLQSISLGKVRFRALAEAGISVGGLRPDVFFADRSRYFGVAIHQNAYYPRRYAIAYALDSALRNGTWGRYAAEDDLESLSEAKLWQAAALDE